MANKRGFQISMTVVLLFLGIFLSMQFRTQQTLAGSLEQQRPQDLVALWKSLTSKRDQLAETMAELNRQTRDLSAEASAGESTLANTVKETARLELLAGEQPIMGSGITITVTAGSPILYLDLVDMVNELWVSGAAAIAVNDHRILHDTGITDAENTSGTYITIDGSRIDYPIVVKAIGDPDSLEKGLTFTGGLIDNLNSLYGIYPRLEKHEQLILPAVPQRIWEYAFPVQPKERQP